MPEMIIGDSQGRLRPYDPQVALAYMHYPHDADTRETAIIAIQAAAALREVPADADETLHRSDYPIIEPGEALHNDGPVPWVAVPASHLKRMVNAPRVSLAALLGRVPPGARVAGLMMMELTRLNAHKPGKVGTLAAQQIVGQMIARWNARDKRKRPGNRSDQLKQWGLFKSVAHLWMAYFWHRNSPNTWPVTLSQAARSAGSPMSMAEWQIFLAVAERIAEQALTIRRHGKRPIFAAEELWRVPASMPLPPLEKLPETLGNLSDIELQALTPE